MNKSESKYFHTAVCMDKAFLALLEKKDPAYITVKEICEKASFIKWARKIHPVPIFLTKTRNPRLPNGSW